MPTGAPIHRTAQKNKGLAPTDESEPKRVLVVGGTSFIGKLLVAELLKHHHDVSILHRCPQHPFGKRVTNLMADRADIDAVKKAVGAARFDVVYDLAYDWKNGTSGRQVEAMALLFDGKVGRYVFMSSVSAYGDGLNHHEGDALAPDDHPNPYVRNKAVAERSLFRLHQRTGFPVVTLRPPFVYGPGNPFYREAFFWDRFRAGRPVILPSEGHRLMQFIYVNDLVDLCLRVMDLRNVLGHSFNAANPRAVTQRELVLDLARAGGLKAPELAAIPRDFIARLGGKVMDGNLYFGSYYDVPAITQIITKAQRMLAFKPVDFEEGLKTAYRAYLKETHYPKPDFTFEDQVMHRFASLSSQQHVKFA
jgi:nucleoside-diphosphate-sugar epimerase